MARYNWSDVILGIDPALNATGVVVFEITRPRPGIGATRMTTIKGDIVTNRELPAGHLARCYLESATSMLPAGEYDVEVTLTPRRWAPEGYVWEGDALRHSASTTKYTVYSDALGVGRLRATNAQLGGGANLGVPADAFRAFEKAGLL